MNPPNLISISEDKQVHLLTKAGAPPLVQRWTSGNGGSAFSNRALAGRSISLHLDSWRAPVRHLKIAALRRPEASTIPACAAPRKQSTLQPSPSDPLGGNANG